MNTSFRCLEDFILPPPLGPLAACLMVLGAWYLGDAFSRRWRGQAASGLERAASFVVVVALLASLSHAIAWLGIAVIPQLRVVGGALAALGLARIVELIRVAPKALAAGSASLQALARLERLGTLLVLGIAAGLTLAALGPPTDSDSLNYHLGVPLDWLRHGGAYARPDWFHARLVGLGEALNLLGLAMGSDQLGAVLQTSGLIVAAVAVGSIAPAPFERVLGYLLVVTAPVMEFLVPNQKPMLLPAAATLVAVVLLVRERSRLSVSTTWVVLSSMAFAAGCKASFLPSSAIVGTVTLVFGRRSGILGWVIAASAATVLVLLVPGWMRTWTFYGDPISPFMECLRRSPDLGVVQFAAYLRHGILVPSLRTYLWLPIGLAVPASLGEVSVVLGVGVWGLVLMKRSSAFAAWLGGLAAILAFMTLAMGQLAPRFLLQSYLWGAAAVAATPHSKGARVLFVALCIQGGVSLSMAWFGALTLGPGSLGQSSRDSVMDRAALGASEARWMDRVLPADAVALTSAHSLALLPRAFLLDDEDSPYGLAEGSTVRAEQRRRKLVAFLKANHANTVVSEPDSIVEDLLRDCLAPIAGPEVFPVATRNPANRGATHKLEASRIAWERPGCALH